MASGRVVVISLILLLLAGYEKPTEEAAELWEPIGKYEVTAYCPCEKCCGRWADGKTADGTTLNPRSRVVAAPQRMSFGELVVIPDYGVARVADRGRVIKGRKLDVFFWTHDKALRWGRRWVQVRRLNSGKR